MHIRGANAIYASRSIHNVSVPADVAGTTTLDDDGALSPAVPSNPPLSFAPLALASSGVPSYSHIVVVVEENHDYSQIIGNTVDAPYINALAAANALLTNYTAISHPSQPNYYALYAGSTFGVTDDNPHTVPDPSLATVLQGAGRTFVGYVDTPNSSYDHNPWESFPEGFSVEQDFSAFPTTNFNLLPTVSFVIPSVDHDMHTGTIAQGDAWLQANLGAYATWAKANNSLLVVTWDENDGSSGNRVATILDGAHVNPGTYATAYNHYNLLSTILASYGLTGPNNAATAAPIGNGVFSVCFASGTHILTSRGEVPVERLSEGDLVVTVSNGQPVLKPVKWLGQRRIDIAAHPRPAAVAPIRIRRGAIARDMPKRDLLLSPDHCLFIDGKLIPAKLLVNGMTVVQELAARGVHYYHVELERHAVLVAEGLPVESYLDTGNRAFFANAGLALVLHPEFHVNAGLKCWAEDACAPLAVSPAAIEPVWRRVAERARQLGHAPSLQATTDDPDLCLLVAGRGIRPVSTDRGRYVFVLPVAPSVRLVSRAVVPSDVVPWLDDFRSLGVAIRRIVLRSAEGEVVIPVDHPSLTRGWHVVEREGGRMWRWTDGNAELPIGQSTGGAITLEVHVAHTATYIAAAPPAPARMAS
ncbi:MAG: Hint domain-containing protein [Alphaproteobacteria bacterium]|nr:Hint domain-containing protein [Alphaproteobacteria bacterium]